MVTIPTGWALHILEDTSYGTTFKNIGHEKIHTYDLLLVLFLFVVLINTYKLYRKGTWNTMVVVCVHRMYTAVSLSPSGYVNKHTDILGHTMSKVLYVIRSLLTWNSVWCFLCFTSYVRLSIIERSSMSSIKKVTFL